MNMNELPQYRSHKLVRAAKIVDILGAQSDRPAVVVEVGEGPEAVYATFVVTTNWLEHRKPAVGGYLVVYEDGYTSFSPAEAFEDGYTPVVVNEVAASDAPLDVASAPSEHTAQGGASEEGGQSGSSGASGASEASGE